MTSQIEHYNASAENIHRVDVEFRNNQVTVTEIPIVDGIVGSPIVITLTPIDFFEIEDECDGNLGDALIDHLH